MEVSIMPIELSSLVVRGEGLMSAPIDKEIVILNMAKNNYVGLDDIGRRIWGLLEKPIRVDELCAQLSRDFEATREQIIADVTPFLEELAREGIVHFADKQPA